MSYGGMLYEDCYKVIAFTLEEYCTIQSKTHIQYKLKLTICSRGKVKDRGMIC